MSPKELPCPNDLQPYNCSFNYVEPNDFYKARVLGRYGFIIWRLMICLLHIILMLFIWIDNGYSSIQRSKLLIYYAYWSYLLLVFSTIVDLVLVVYCDVFFRTAEEKKILLRTEKEESNIPWFMRIWWMVMNLAYSTTFISTIVFWGFIRPHTPDLINNGWIIVLHVEGCVYIVINMAFSRMPVRIYHVWLVVCFNVVYGFFTGVYYMCGGTNIYGGQNIYFFINWDSNRKQMMLYASLALFLSALIGQIIIFAIYKFYRVFDLCTLKKTMDKLPEKVRENIPMQNFKASKD